MTNINISASTDNISASVNNVNVKNIFVDTKYPSGNFASDIDCKVKGQYFKWNTNAYDNEKLMYTKLMNGAFNQHGIKTTYYTSDYDITYDMIFGEDRDRYIIRNFPVMMWAELPPQDRQFGQFGIDEVDNFHVYISKSHFVAASRLNYTGNPLINAYDSLKPKIGDIFKFNYNNIFYEIIYINEQEQMFLQTKHSWDLVVRVFRDNKLSVSASTSATMGDLLNISDITDILSINTEVDSKKSDIIYEPGIDENPTNDPFAGW